MRSRIVFVLLVASWGILLGLGFQRKAGPHPVSSEVAQALGRRSATTLAKGDGPARSRDASRRLHSKPSTPEKPAGATPPASSAKRSRATSPQKDRADTAAVPKGHSTTKPKPKAIVPKLKRPLRVIGLGWDVVAPAVLANGGAKPDKSSRFKRKRLDVRINALDAPEALEAALARGGADKLGADIAILPLPTFVASYERLRALQPQVLFVASWSRGREGLMLPPSVKLTRLPKSMRLLGRPGDPATLFSLYMLDLAGVAPERVRLTSPKKPPSRDPQPDQRYYYVSEYRLYVRRMLEQQRRAMSQSAIAAQRPAKWQSVHRFATTTADAPRLIPIVAVAAGSFIKKHHDALMVWSRVWFEGVRLLRDDVAEAARRIARLENAPEPLQLVQRLGQYQPASLRDSARAAGLSGRSPLLLDELFRMTWRLWRGVGVLSTPAPRRAPLCTELLTALVHRYPKLVRAAPSKIELTPQQRDSSPRAMLLSVRPRLRRLDENAVTLTLARLATIFAHAELRLSLRGKQSRAERLVADTAEIYQIDQPQRLTATARRSGRLVHIDIMRPL